MSESLKFIVTTIINGVGIIIPILFYFILIGKYKEKISNNEKNITEIKNDIKSVNTNIHDIPWKMFDAIGRILGSKEMKAASFVQSRSPISLSEKGNNIAEKIKANEIIENHKNDLTKRVRNKTPKTAYEKQKFSEEIIQEYFIKDIISEEEKISLQDFAYEEGYDLDSFLIIFSIKLRDIILEEDNHSYNEVDETDPTFKK